MTPAEYIPDFNPAVTGWLPEDSTKPPRLWSYSQYYCLMPPSARMLAKLFSPQPSIVMLPPITVASGSPFAFSDLVPWFSFTMADNTVQLRNAGQLAIYWGMPGVPDPLAECLLDIDPASIGFAAKA
jgi:hypothetical protein